jgi:predicted small lipoprotein YifL
MSTKPGFLLARIAAALSLGIALAGCGLKGPLALPEKSGNVVIRGASPTAVPTTPGTTTGTGAPADGSTPPATETKVPPAPEKMPPPDLPHSNAGASR